MLITFRSVFNHLSYEYAFILSRVPYMGSAIKRWLPTVSTDTVSWFSEGNDRLKAISLLKIEPESLCVANRHTNNSTIVNVKCSTVREYQREQTVSIINELIYFRWRTNGCILCINYYVLHDCYQNLYWHVLTLYGSLFSFYTIAYKILIIKYWFIVLLSIIHWFLIFVYTVIVIKWEKEKRL